MNVFRGDADVVMWSNRKPTSTDANGDPVHSDIDKTAGGLGTAYATDKDKEIYQWELTDRLWNHIKFTVSNPKIMLSCLDVELTVNILL